MAKLRVFDDATHIQGITPMRLHIPANHIPEKPTEYVIPVLPQNAHPERYEDARAHPVTTGPISLLPTKYSSNDCHCFFPSIPSKIEIPRRTAIPADEAIAMPSVISGTGINCVFILPTSL
jgi:hypothetical protein